MTLEDLCVHGGKVTGVVVNRTTISGALPVDPIVLQAENVIDGTGHEAVAVERLRARNLLAPQLASAGSGEGPMDATAGEAFVVERVAEAYPGLWVTGMAVCATFGGPRMGPIFGGMLLSGKRVAELILEKKMKRIGILGRWTGGATQEAADASDLARTARRVRRGMGARHDAPSSRT